MSTMTSNNLGFEDYKELFDKLVEKGETSGENQTEALIAFTKLNKQRMKRVEKQFKIDSEFETTLKNKTTPMQWTVLVETWCGDAAQNMPIIAKIAQILPDVELEILFRDENLELMDQNLTNGGRAIPKLICTNRTTNKHLWSWGPRPTEIQNFVLNFKKENPESTHDEFNQELHLFYGKNRGDALMDDLKELLG